jgi:hypothetical protein
MTTGRDNTLELSLGIGWIDTGVDGLVLLEGIIPPSSHCFYYYRWTSAGLIPVLVD